MSEYRLREDSGETVYRVVPNLGEKATDSIPVLPNNLGTITKPWLIRWAEWVAAGKPPIDRQAQNDFNPALHPRDPRTGKFVERSFDVPDDIPDFSGMSSPEILSYMSEQGVDVDPILQDDGVSIDGVPGDVESASELPDAVDTGESGVGERLTDSGVDQLSPGDIVSVDGERAEVVDSSSKFLRADVDGETRTFPTVQHEIRAVDTSLDGVSGGGSGRFDVGDELTVDTERRGEVTGEVVEHNPEFDELILRTPDGREVLIPEDEISSVVETPFDARNSMGERILRIILGGRE